MTTFSQAGDPGWEHAISLVASLFGTLVYVLWVAVVEAVGVLEGFDPVGVVHYRGQFALGWGYVFPCDSVCGHCVEQLSGGQDMGWWQSSWVVSCGFYCAVSG